MRLLACVLLIQMALGAAAQTAGTGPPYIRMSLSNSTNHTYVFTQNNMPITGAPDPVLGDAFLAYAEGSDLVAHGRLRWGGGNVPVTVRLEGWLQPGEPPLMTKVVLNGLWAGWIPTAGPNYSGGSVLQTEPQLNSADLNVRTLLPVNPSPPGAGPIYHTITVGGDMVWVFASGGGGGGGGGESGVNATDWDYWFDVETGKLLNWYDWQEDWYKWSGPGEPDNGKMYDIHGGLLQWFGPGGGAGGEMRSSVSAITTQLTAMLSLVNTIRAAVAAEPTEPGPGEVLDYEFTLNDLTLPHLEEDFGFGNRRSSFFDAMPSMSDPWLNTDATVAPVLQWEVPIESWFGGLSSTVQNFTLTIDTGPYTSVRGYIFTIVYALLAVWAALFVFAEFRR